jgi:hypothetical protein
MFSCAGRAKRKPLAFMSKCTLGALLLGLVGSAHADHYINAGGVVSLSGGTISLGCTDLVIGGTLNFDSGTYRAVRNVTVLAGGALHGGTGTLRLSGTLTVAPGGLHNPQQLSVMPATECGAGGPAPVQPVVIPTLNNALLAALALLLFSMGLTRLPFRRTLHRLERIKP